MLPYNYIIIIILIIILIFFYDFNNIQMLIISDQYPTIIELQKDYNKCKEELKQNMRKEAECEFIKGRINSLTMSKPSIISVFFVWIIDAFKKIFNLLNIYNIIILIIIMFSLKFIIFS